MRKLIAALFVLACYAAHAAETIKIYSPYSPSHSATPAMFKIIDLANHAQNIYSFVLEFKPGGNQIIALNAMDSNSLGIIAPAFVENVTAGRLNLADYVPVHALGDACWAVITNGPLTSRRELTVGGVGIGNATHLTALALGEKYKFTTQYVVFKSNNDALVNMVGNNGIFMVIDRYESYESMRTQNSHLQVFAVSCPSRLPQAPNIPTLSELKIDAPLVFNITVAHKSMDPVRRLAISNILTTAQRQVGAEEIFKLSGMRVPKVSAEEFYTKSIEQVQRLQEKYRKEINANK